jgi:hypothetical protein
MDPLELFRQLGMLAKVTIFVGAVPLVAAAVYAAWPTEARLALMRPLSLAGVFSAFTGVLGGLATGLAGLARRPEGVGAPGMYAGLAEALVPSTFGLMCLTVAWLLVAVGMARGGRSQGD